MMQTHLHLLWCQQEVLWHQQLSAVQDGEGGRDRQGAH